MKKAKIIFSSLVILLFFPFASAAVQIPQSLTDILELLLGSVQGGTTSEVLLVKLLVFILLLAVINTAVRRIPTFGDNKTVTIIISLVVSLLGVRYITTSSLVDFIWLPQGVLALVLTSLMPFIIALFFFEGFDSAVIRKVGWTAFLVIFGGLAYFRWSDLSTGPLWYQNWAWMYLIIAIASGLLIYFDRQIRAYFVTRSLGSISDRHRRIAAADLMHEINENRARLRHADPATTRDIRNEIRDQERRLREILSS